MSDLVYMTHAASPDHAPAATTRDAFEALWQEKGWQLVEDGAADSASAEAAPPAPPSRPKPDEKPAVVVNPNLGG